MRIGTTPLKHAALFIYFPSILMSLGQGMLIPALPVLGETFGVSGAVAVQALTAQLLGRGITLIPAGAAIDRWGAKPVMIVGASVAALSGVAAATAPNFFVVLLAQLTWGAGTSIWMFGREIAAFDMVQADQRGRQMSALMGIGSTGMAFGPAVGGILTDIIGIRALFWVYSAASAVVLGISIMQRHAKVTRERKRRPLFNFGAIKQINPYFKVTYLVLFIATFGQMARGQVTNSALPLYTQEALGYSATTTGLIFSVMGLTTFLMIVPTGFISDKLGRKWAATPAAVFSLIGFVLLPFFSSVPSLMFVAFVIGIANGLAMGAMTIYTFDIVPDEFKGQLQALRRSVGELGAVISPPVVGILAVTFSPSAPFWFFAPLHALSAVLLIFVAKESLRKRLPAGAAPPTSGPTD
ncbi:MAG: MFS transporter, partial [Chloroflexi bacterium]|nr:MFS transporter [Chloroflexota bacterium]